MTRPLGTTPFSVPCFKVGDEIEVVSADNPLPVDATLVVGDIEIGAVEIQDASSGNRAAVDASGRLSVDGSSVTQPVSAAALPLPAGAATSGNQTTALSSLGSIVTNTALIAAGNASLASLDGKTVAVNTGAIAFASPQHVIVDSGSLGSVTVSGTVNVGTVTTLPVGHNIIDSGSITVANASIPVTQGGAFSVSIDGTVPVTGPLTDTQLRASDVSVTSPALEVAQGAVSTDLVGPMVLGVVSDAPTSPLNDVTAPLSMTKQGRLRVAMVAEELGVSFTSVGEAAMWGNLKTDYTFTGSPWSGW